MNYGITVMREGRKIFLTGENNPVVFYYSG